VAAPRSKGVKKRKGKKAKKQNLELDKGTRPRGLPRPNQTTTERWPSFQTNAVLDPRAETKWTSQMNGRFELLPAASRIAPEKAAITPDWPPGGTFGISFLVLLVEEAFFLRPLVMGEP
jgi:hypothetical protein